MRISRREAICSSLSVLLLWCGPAPGAVPTASTQTFLDQHPGSQGTAHGERLIALYGVPCATDADPLTTT